MASLSHTYTDTLKDNLLEKSRARFGRSRRRHTATAAFERNERYGNGAHGSHMPIDTEIHWEWSNPINLLPALILLFLAVALLAMVLG